MAGTFTEEQLTALTEAIASGSKRVKYADKEVEYNSLREMMMLRDLMMRELGERTRASVRKYYSLSKGLGRVRRTFWGCDE